MIKSRHLRRNRISYLFLTFILIISISNISVNTLNDSVEVKTSITENATPQPLSKAKEQNVKYDLPFTGFIKNQGQVENSAIQYYYTADGFSIGFLESSIDFVIKDQDRFSISFPGSARIVPVGLNQQTHYNNYFTGDLSFTKVPTYYEIVYNNLYPGIDLRYYMTERGLKYDFIVNPSANPTEIQIQVSDSIGLEISPEIVNYISPNTPDGIQIQDTELLVFQETKENAVPSHFLDLGKNLYGFSIPNYDASRVLIIDPLMLTFSTFIGGSGDDEGNAVVVDSFGNIYITGNTADSTTNFPVTTGSYDVTHNGGSTNGYDVFVVKLDPSGSSLIFSTFLGGSGDDYGRGIAVDVNNNTYITGYTLDHTIDFPTTAGAYDTLAEHAGVGGQDNVFVTKLNPNGDALVYSTFIGGYNTDKGRAIVLDSSNNAYVTGYAGASFPTTVGAYNQTHGGGGYDVFVAKVNAAGSDLVFSTFIGSDGREYGNGIDIDSGGNVYITGEAEHTISDVNFYPTTVGAYDVTHGGGFDAFVTKLSSTGASLVYSTFLGGTSTDAGRGIAVDQFNNAYVVGDTFSSGFPTTAGAYSTSVSGPSDIFVSKLTAVGNILSYSTLLGSTSNDWGMGIAVDQNLEAYVTGMGSAFDFPTTPDAYETAGANGAKAILTHFDSTGSNLVYSTVLGGSSTSVGRGNAIALDSKANIYVAGYTSASTFPTTFGAYDRTFNGLKDAFVSKFTIPASIDQPSDIYFEDGSLFQYLTWNPIGSDPDFYEILKNGVIVDTGTWSSGNQITFRLDDLGVGTFLFQINLYEVSGASVLDTAAIFITDTISPSINSPSDFSYEFGSTGNSIPWLASDFNPSTYKIYRNGSLYINSPWTSGTPIIINVDGLDVGNYNYTIEIFDETGNVSYDQIIISVRDTTIPTLTTLSDFNYNEGDTGQILIWNANDLNEATYEIYKNGVLWFTGNWITGLSISLNINGLYKGVYNYTVIVFDQYGNWNSDEVIVTVLDGTPPSVSSPADIYTSFGESGNSISWDATDIHEDSYTILKNGTILETNVWTSGTSIEINVDGLAIGVYNYTIILTDTSGNSMTDEVNVIVSDDTIVPGISLLDFTPYYIEGTVGNTILWRAYDDNAGSYVLYIDDVQVETMSWVSNTDILINIDGLLVGTHNITIVVSDQYGNSASDEVLVDVVDTTPPILNSPTDIEYEEGTIGNVILWTAIDNYAGNYALYIDDIQVEDLLWVSNIEIIIDIDGLSVGSYNITIVVYDQYGNSVSDEVFVNVVDKTPPILNSPTDIEYEKGVDGNEISWTVTDNNPNSYIIYKNDVELTNGIWSSGVAITVNVDGLPTGTYVFRIDVSDRFDNSITDSVSVTVTAVVEDPSSETSSSSKTAIDGSSTSDQTGEGNGDSGFLPIPGFTMLLTFLGIAYLHSFIRKKRN